MQYWPRTRAKRIYPRVRTTPPVQEAKPILFAGYKAGMSHVVVTDNRKNSITKGESVAMPITIIECPPLNILGVRLYTRTDTNALQAAKDILLSPSAQMKRKQPIPKKKTPASLDTITITDYQDLTLLAYTAPEKTGKKKKPELFEIPLGGSLEEKWQFVKERADKPLLLGDVFAEGDMVDVKAITKGKGNQGPVKRFGINLRSHKSEKTKRGPGSLGPWKSQAHILYRVPHAGQTGYHQRTELHKQILSISDDTTRINPDGGFIRYGLVKNPYLILKGSIPGPKKRLIFITKTMRGKPATQAPELGFISLASQQ